jgi:hypothetical protein
LANLYTNRCTPLLFFSITIISNLLWLIIGIFYGIQSGVLKIYLFETIINDNNRFWFRHRIGYVMIPIIYFILFTSPYIALIILSLIFPTKIHFTKCLYTVDLIFYITTIIIGNLIDIGLFFHLGMTPLYYGDLIIVDHTTVRTKIYAQIVTIIKIVSTILSTIITIIIYMHDACYYGLIAIPSMITSVLVMMIACTIYIYRSKKYSPYEDVYLL